MTDPLGKIVKILRRNRGSAYHFTKSKYNNNKHNMVIVYKKWKKYNEIHLTKNEMSEKNEMKKQNKTIEK